MEKYLDLPLAEWTLGHVLDMLGYMIVTAAPYVVLGVIALAILGAFAGLIQLLEKIWTWIRKEREVDSNA